MLRSRRHRAKSPLQWLAHNPFLTVALLSGLALAALWLELGNERLMERSWLVLGYGFHVAADWLARILPDLYGWLEVALTAVVGLGLYLLLDAIWRRLRPE